MWEGFSFILTLILVYLVYGNFASSLRFALGLTLIKTVLFFVHERAWKNVKWGKYEYNAVKK